jgi:glycosyltransferase involved in cell wall biosynthesis
MIRGADQPLTLRCCADRVLIDICLECHVVWEATHEPIKSPISDFGCDGMKQGAYFLLRRLFLTWQELADTFRVPPDRVLNSADSGVIRSLGLALGGMLYRAARRLIKPAWRARMRSWLVNLAVDQSVPVREPALGRVVMDPGRPTGINLVGYLAAESGLGEAARSIRRAAEAAGIKVAPIDFRRGCSSRMDEHVPEGPSPSERYGVNLIHLNADQLLMAHTMLGPDFFKGYYNIAYSVWEQEVFPDDWAPALELVHEIWTASTFCLDAMSRKTSLPVLRIPHSVDPVVPVGLDRKALGLPEEGLIFLAVLDFCSTPERKNPLGALEAYVMAKERIQQTTHFVLKTVNAVTRPEVMQAIEQLRAECGSIIVREGYVERAEVNALINACDCFVSLHRAEGFGLPLAEAMCMNKPVIATGWSGNMDFMNANNSFPVRFTLQPLDHDVGPYRKGLRWAEPDVGHAAELMALVAQEPERARKIGERAGRDIRDSLSCAAVGELIRERLDRIHSDLLAAGGREQR